MNNRWIAAAVGAALLAGGATQGFAQAPGTKPQPPMSAPQGAGPGPGPGYGCPGWGHPYGMGPGMMGGYGMGPGMMGGYGMGSGMMGGYGMGPGMMGGYGMGPGMMGPGMGYGLAGLNLTDDQRKRINKIMDDQQKTHYGIMGKIMDQNSKLRDLYSQEKWDANAISAAYDEINKQKTLMIRSRIEARNKIYDVLTPEQRQRFRQWGDTPE